MDKKEISSPKDCQKECTILNAKDSKIAELEGIIAEAKECVKIIQEKNEFLSQKNQRLETKLAEFLKQILKAREGAFGFRIKSNETLLQGMIRNYQEFFDERSRLEKVLKITKEMIVRDWLSRLCWCDKCCAIRGDAKQYKEKLKQKLEGVLIAKESQNARPEQSGNKKGYLEIPEDDG